MTRLRILTIVFAIISLAIYSSKDASQTTASSGEGILIDESWLIQSNESLTADQDSRPADQTFLTYPEWFLVHGPAEQAAYYKNNTSTKFPFMKHSDQIWDSYQIVSDQTSEHFTYNEDYHVMIKVIGVSSTVEYGIKSTYESVIGRITDTGIGEELTDEDKFNYKFTQEYVDFIRETPWYEFDFLSQLKHLWTDTDVLGDNLLRKWERKYILSSELILKAGYAKLIKMGTKSMYEEALLTTVVIVDHCPQVLLDDPTIELMETLENGYMMLRVPRYAAFSPTAMKFVNHNVKFIEIAGNSSAILLTVIADNQTQVEIKDSTTLFEQILPSNEVKKRIALVTTVPNLNEVLKQLKPAKLTLEHIYDY